MSFAVHAAHRVLALAPLLAFVCACSGPTTGAAEGEGEGAPTTCDDDTDCAAGLVCADVQCAKTCVAPAAEGADCFEQQESPCSPTESLLDIPCVAGLYCLKVGDDLGEVSGSCEPLGSVGDSCGQLGVEAPQCRPELTCTCHTCVDPSGGAECPEGEVCGGDCVYAGFDDDVSDRCLAPLPAGAACLSPCAETTISRPCADGLACDVPCAGASSCNDVDGCCCG